MAELCSQMGDKFNDSRQLKFQWVEDKGIIFDIPSSNHYRCVVDYCQVTPREDIVLLWVVKGVDGCLV